MTIPFDSNAPPAYDLTPGIPQGPGGKLSESGGGWSNTDLERAHVSGAESAQVQMGRYLADPREATKAWLKALHAPDEVSEACRTCGQVTKRHIVVAVIGTEIREHVFLVVRPQCDDCAIAWERSQLERSLAKPELAEHLKMGFRERLEELQEMLAQGGEAH